MSILFHTKLDDSLYLYLTTTNIFLNKFIKYKLTGQLYQANINIEAEISV
jgi:hypothetical protein